MTVERFLNDRVELHCGDCLVVLPTLAENSIDSVCCDPPYHLTSIVKRFGAENSAPAKSNGASGIYKRASGGFMGKQWDGGDVAFQVDTWAKVLRVMKPGAYLVAFSSTRTFGRMQVACEDAGFITHPLIAWVFGQGFPKATRVKHDDWEGCYYGTQSLKPAIEPIYVGQKPFEKGLSGTENVVKWGCGALNIDVCRVETEESWEGRELPNAEDGVCWGGTLNASSSHPLGRWPANLITDGSEEVLAAFPDASGQQFYVGPEHGDRPSRGIYNDFGPRSENEPRGDSGSAARFFYAAKADSSDRIGSKHPTVKPLDLMQYLVRLVTPPKGICLDPFAGTGMTGEAAWREGFNAVLIEREAEYQEDIRRRMRLALAGPDERARESMKEKMKGKPQDHGPLFGGSENARGGADRFTASSQSNRPYRNDEVVTK